MVNGTCVIFILFYIFRHYKRIEISSKRNDLILDMKKCYILLKQMENSIDPSASIKLIDSLVERINSFGVDMKLQYPLRYADNYDIDIIAIMITLTEEIITLAKSPFYGRNSGEIFSRFLVLHNLPRVLLDDSSGDSSTLQNFHMSKQEALDSVKTYLGESWLDSTRKPFNR